MPLGLVEPFDGLSRQLRRRQASLKRNNAREHLPQKNSNQLTMIISPLLVYDFFSDTSKFEHVIPLKESC